MKTLYESLLDNFDELDKNIQQNAEKSMIDFLIDNYKVDGRPINPDDKRIKISDIPNKDGKYVVDVEGGLMIKNHDIYTLTNNIFVFGEVSEYFDCSRCKKLTSLKGAPEKVGGYFSCRRCIKLKNLDYLPKEIGGSIYVPNHLKNK